MIKVFTTNKNGKIELTKEELKSLLDEAYWDGYKANSGTYTYTSPNVRSCTAATNTTLSSTSNCSTTSTPNSAYEAH